MAAATYGTRILGIWAAGGKELKERYRRWLDQLGASVLAAMICPLILWGDAGVRAGAIVAAAVMFVCRRPFVAMLAAALTAALIRS